MKANLFTTGLLLFCLTSFGQDAKTILQKSYDQCQAVQNGYYEMSRYMKSMSRRDTSESSFNCYFKKLKDDSLFSSAFHYQSFWKGKYEGDAMYTGEDFVTMFIKDSTAEIMSKTLWAKEIKSYAHNYKFYSPLTNRKSSPIQHDSDLINNQIIYKLISEENLNGIQCYHIQVNETPEIDTAEMAQPLRIEYHYWINKTDFIPIQYSTAYDLEMNNDTMYQFEK